MKRAFALLLILILCLSASACELLAPAPSPEPEHTPAPTPTPPPTGIELWKQNTLRRYNMEYADFAEYWSLMCDGYFGDAPQRILSVFVFEDKETEIKEKRAEFYSKYGKSAHYEIISATEAELSEKYRSDFAKELEGLYGKAQLFLTECAAWDDGDWESFSEHIGCTADKAKTLEAAYADIAEACHGKSVEKALTLTSELKFSNGTKRTETVNLYVIDGYYVSEQLIDVTDMLLNLVF